MKEVIAFIRPDKWQDTREVACALGAEEIMHWRVLGRGRQRGLRYLRPLTGGEEWGMQFLPKWMASWLIDSSQVDAFVSAIIQANNTNNYGDGKIFVCPVDEESDAAPAVKTLDAQTRL
ncbi:MAG: P-II family nitrogen regulator [Chloroflexi bacterium]|nr:P-II family nitrogen regulator [Chloroflexota bacterium]MDA1271525.1 P-II family nitrogen regulator [Chloroflexota bacterium]PKB58535.1 MAG: hypothetical protein BZY83_06535 [SAR202 cluster bacterium Casp-Chloro-G2]